MTKRIHLAVVNPFGDPHSWRATSTRYGVSAYGRTLAEARSRLFLVRQSEYRNLFAAANLQAGEYAHYLGLDKRINVR